MNVPAGNQSAVTIAEIIAAELQRNPDALAILAPDRPVLDYKGLAACVERIKADP